jgi:allantoin racemase
MMKRIAFINPNSTVAMTDSCATSLQSVIGDGFDVRAVTNHDGPPAIQGTADGETAIPGLLAAVAENEDCDGIILGCFDDTGLAEARAMTQRPVIGIGQAAFHLAALRSGAFQILTTLAVSIPVIQDNVEQQGFGDICSAVLASGVPVLELEHDPEGAAAVISGHIADIEAGTNAPTIILGCAGMTNIHQRLQARHDAVLIDPIMAAARLIPALL